MTDKVARVLLEFEIQKQKLSTLRQANADVLKDFEALGTGAIKAGDRARDFTTALQDQRERLAATREESTNLRASVLGLDTSLKDAGDGTVSLTGQLAKAREEIQKVKDAADEAGPSLEALTGDSNGNSGGGSNNGPAGLKRGGEVLSRLGAGEAGRGLSTVGDLANIGKFKEELGSLSPTTLAAGAAVVGFTVVLDLYTKAQEQARQAALADIDGRQKAIELAASGTQEQIQAEINKLQKQKEINIQLAADANQLFGNLREEVKNQLGGGALALEDLAATAGKAAGSFQAAHDAADKSNASVGALDTQLQILEQATGKVAQSAAEAAAAEQQLANVRNQLSVFSQNASDLKQILDLEATGTNTQQVQDIVDGKKREIAVNKIYQQASLDLAATLDKDSQSYKDAIAEAQKYADANARLQNWIDRAVESTYKLVAARQREAETIDATKQFNEDRAKSTDDYLNQITDIETKNAEKLVDLANKKADAEEAALSKLNDKVASLGLAAQRAVEDAGVKAQRDAADQQVKYQAAEAKAAREHANNLLKIQSDANAKADDLIAKRDFTGLLRLRQDTTRQLQSENDKYSQSEQDRVDQVKQERDQRLVQYVREAQDRQTKYNRDLQDARSQYNKELSDAASKYNKGLSLQQAAGQAELSLAQSKYAAQQQLLQQSIQNELAIINQGNLAKAIALNAGNQQLLAQAAQYAQGNFGGNTAGISANTNSVNNNNNSRTVTAPITINGGNARAIASAVRSQLSYLIN